MSLASKRLVLFLSIVTLLFGVGCGSQPSAPADGAQSAVSPATPPKKLTAGELVKLRWIEGSWRGTGDIQKPFYERYRFENESTLVMEELADETLSEVKDVTRYALSNGEFSNGHYVATDLDDKSITFSPLTKGRDSFRWQTESKDAWTAILKVPASGSNPAREVVYKLERWPAAKTQ